MQKAKAEAEEAARSKSESTDHSSDSKENTKTPTGEADKALTPKQETNEKIASSGEQTKTSTALSSSRSKHKKTRSESAREATFASLQRALDAAAAAREQHIGDEGDSQSNTNDFEESVSPTTTTTTTTSAFSSIKGSSKRNSHSGGNGQNAYGATLEWEAPRDPSVAWSYGSQEAYGYAPLLFFFCEIDQMGLLTVSGDLTVRNARSTLKGKSGWVKCPRRRNHFQIIIVRRTILVLRTVPCNTPCRQKLRYQGELHQMSLQTIWKALVFTPRCHQTACRC